MVGDAESVVVVLAAPAVVLAVSEWVDDVSLLLSVEAAGGFLLSVVSCVGGAVCSWRMTEFPGRMAAVLSCRCVLPVASAEAVSEGITLVAEALP